MFNFIEALFSNLLVVLYSQVNNLGAAIIIFTVLIRSLLIPVSNKAIKSTKQIGKLQPELEKLKKKFAKDPQAMQKAQMDLYRKHKVNPFSGCLPQIVQLIILIGLYRSLKALLDQPIINNITVSTSFLWLDLSKPDGKFILPFLVAAIQMIYSLIAMPALSQIGKKKKKGQKQEMSEADVQKLMMMFSMPILSGIMVLKFPAGLGVYWVVTTFFSVVQQLIIAGPGNLKTLKQYFPNKLKK